MGRIRKQAAGALLPAHHSRQAQVAIRSRALESDDCGYCRDIADNSRGSMNMWTRFRSWTAAMLCRNRKERRNSRCSNSQTRRTHWCALLEVRKRYQVQLDVICLWK